MEMISSSPQIFLFSLCACFLILHSFKFPPSVRGSFLEAARGNETDQQALLAFKDEITRDPFGALNSWNHSLHFCQWFGVTCGRLHRQRVTKLVLDHQNLGGFISPHIGNLSFLRELWLRNNSLGSKIPPEIGRLRRLQQISLYNNSIGGEIPTNISRCSNLVSLELSRNNLEGQIPAELGMLSKLEFLRIGRNFKIAGAIPTSLANLSSLQIFFASGNIIDGSIPDQLGRLSKLEFFGVGFNKLVGTIPPSIWNITSMDTFVVANNYIGGTLPPELGGIIFPRVHRFFIYENLFTGTIPVSISNASYLEDLEIHSNKLFGDVPPMEKLVHLWFLNLGQNFLGTAGNIKLCGGIPELGLPGCNHEPPKKKLRLKLIIGLAFGVTSAVLFLLFIYLCCSKRPRKLPSLRSPWNSLLRLSYQSLHEATNGFSATNLIGMGSFGSVYKGLLSQRKQIVAVKVLNLQLRGATRSFLAECEALRRIRHRNLLKVLTACSSIDHQGNDFKALVYDFMPNGSVDHWLHPPESQDETKADAKNLDLSQRLDIVIGVASAVEHLHHRCQEPIVHCDLKPSNILLDNDMVAHVGDFGLAKLIQEGTSLRSSDNQSSTIGLRGSVGYVAPEYGMGNEVSVFGDVYSYGIIVLEMFTGKRPTDDHLFNGCLNLREHVEMALPEQVDTVADPRLLLFGGNGDTTKSGSDKIEECLVSLLRVGISCAQELPRDRMNIIDAIIQLHAIKKDLLRNGVVERATPSMRTQIPK